MNATHHHVSCAVDFHIPSPMFLKRGANTAMRDARVNESDEGSVVFLRVKHNTCQKRIAGENLGNLVLVVH